MLTFTGVPFARLIPHCCAESTRTEPRKQRIRARVAYDGTNFKGWQFQPHLPTVQGVLEDSLSRKFGDQIRAVGASRTDTGVHARGQAMHFDVPIAKALRGEDDVQKFQFTFNQMLPADVRVQHVSIAPPLIRSQGHNETEETSTSIVRRPWHAIYDATGKLYTYRLSTGSVFDPLNRLYRYHDWRAAKFGFSEELLHRAANKFVGSHDFSAFTNTANPPPGFEPPVLANPIRHIYSADVIHEGDGLYRIEFRISGAMYRMIRNVVGTILDVACRKMDISHVDTLFTSKDRRLVPKSAPAKGLCLEKVFYENWEA